MKKALIIAVAAVALAGCRITSACPAALSQARALRKPVVQGAAGAEVAPAASRVAAAASAVVVAGAVR